MKLVKFSDFKVVVAEDTFEPTTISKVVPKLGIDVRDKKLLDLGCGVGPIAIHFSREGADVTASDVSERHIHFTELNAHNNNVNINVIHSDLFESIEEKFDIIFCDVSGIPKYIADITDWYPEGVPVADDTGNNLIHTVVDEAPKYLNENGELYICSSSLSNQFKLIRKLQDNFSYSYMYDVKPIPFCKELYSLVEDGSLNTSNYHKKGSRYCWDLYVYKAVL